MDGFPGARAAGGALELDHPYRAPAAACDGRRPKLPAAEATLASRSARLAAVLIDYLVVVGAALPLLGMEVWATSIGADSLLTPLTIVLLLELVALGAVQSVLIVRDGQSLGKRWMRIRVVDHLTGERPSWVRLLLVRVLGNLALRQIPLYYPIDGAFILGLRPSMSARRHRRHQSRRVLTADGGTLLGPASA